MFVHLRQSPFGVRSWVPRESSRFSSLVAGFSFKLSDAGLPSAAETDRSPSLILDHHSPKEIPWEALGSVAGLLYEFYVILQMAWWQPRALPGKFFEAIRKIE